MVRLLRAAAVGRTEKICTTVAIFFAECYIRFADDTVFPVPTVEALCFGRFLLGKIKGGTSHEKNRIHRFSSSYFVTGADRLRLAAEDRPLEGHHHRGPQGRSYRRSGRHVPLRRHRPDRRR